MAEISFTYDTRKHSHDCEVKTRIAVHYKRIRELFERVGLYRKMKIEIVILNLEQIRRIILEGGQIEKVDSYT